MTSEAPTSPVYGRDRCPRIEPTPDRYRGGYGDYGPVWPRGCVAPAVAVTVIGVAVAVAVAGETWDAYQSLRNGRRARQVLRRMGVLP